MILSNDVGRIITQKATLFVEDYFCFFSDFDKNYHFRPEETSTLASTFQTLHEVAVDLGIIVTKKTLCGKIRETSFFSKCFKMMIKHFRVWANLAGKKELNSLLGVFDDFWERTGKVLFSTPFVSQLMYLTAAKRKILRLG